MFKKKMGMQIAKVRCTARYLLDIVVQKTSVPDPGCLSRIPDPDFYPSRIPDLGSRIQKPQQKRGVKKNFFVIPLYVATNFTKLKITLVLK
jgi:hypothetical protein